MKLEREASSAEAVFMSQFIPRSLNQIDEKEQKLMSQGKKEGDFVDAIGDLTGGTGGGKKKVKFDDDEHDEEGDSDEEENSSDYESGVDSDGEGFVKIAMTLEELAARKEERREFLRENKKLVKEQNAIKRTTKVKKKDKKRAINKAKNKRKGGG